MAGPRPRGGRFPQPHHYCVKHSTVNAKSLSISCVSYRVQYIYMPIRESDGKRLKTNGKKALSGPWSEAGLTWYSPRL